MMFNTALKSLSKGKFSVNFAIAFHKNTSNFTEIKQKVSDKMNETKQQQVEFSEEQKKIINSYRVDKTWNIILDIDPDHNFQKDLVVYKRQFQNSTKQLRQAILFEDLLKTQIIIPIYDTKKKTFHWQLLKLLYMFFTVGGAIWAIHSFRNIDPKNAAILDHTTTGKVGKAILYFLCFYVFFKGFLQHLSWRKRFVEKILYDTKRQEFTIIKRSFWLYQRPRIVSRFKLLYTENEFLTSKGTNYFDIDTKEQFQIGLKSAWIKQDLFSHLISQRIKI